MCATAKNAGLLQVTLGSKVGSGTTPTSIVTTDRQKQLHQPLKVGKGPAEGTQQAG